MVTALLAADTGDGGAPLWVVIVGWVLTVGVVLLGSRQLVLTRWDRLERLVRITGQLPDGEARELMLAATTYEVRNVLTLEGRIFALPSDTERPPLPGGVTEAEMLELMRQDEEWHRTVLASERVEALLSDDVFTQALAASRRSDTWWALARAAGVVIAALIAVGVLAFLVPPQ